MKVTHKYINNEDQQMYIGFYDDETKFELTIGELRDISFKYIMGIVTKVDRKKLSNEQEKWLDRCALNVLTKLLMDNSLLNISLQEYINIKMDEIKREEDWKKQQQEITDRCKEELLKSLEN